MRHITRPLVQKSFRSLMWAVTWPRSDEDGRPRSHGFRQFDTWTEAYAFARSLA